MPSLYLEACDVNQHFYFGHVLTAPQIRVNEGADQNNLLLFIRANLSSTQTLISIHAYHAQEKVAEFL